MISILNAKLKIDISNLNCYISFSFLIQTIKRTIMTFLNSETADYIRKLKTTLPEILLERHFLMQPELKTKYSEKQIKHYLEDTRFHLSYLSQAIESDEQVLFNDYLAWAKSSFKNLPVTDIEIITNLKLLRDGLIENATPNVANLISQYINKGIEYYINYDPYLESYIEYGNPFSEEAAKYLDFLVYGDKKSAQQLIMELVNNGATIKDIYTHIFQVTQKETGRLWQIGKINVAQEHLITAATQLIMSLLYPYLFSTVNKGKKVLVACIEGEMHEIGARMVADFFEMEGWNSYYVGANTPKNSLINTILSFKPDVIAISVTMVFNLSAVTELINELKAIESLKNTKIIVGGYPFLIANNLWKTVGADGCGCDGKNAIVLADELIN